MNKIAIICPYFGKFPSYIDLTFESMGVNKMINWIIFTDNDVSKYNYNNIHFFKMTFGEMKKLIKEKINTDVESPYKLCDYKPTYGFIFENFIKKYNYWGYCDLDIIFGNLSNYINEEKLKNFDKIYDLGHLAIMPNTEKFRKIFMEDVGNISYKEILNRKNIYVFDESYNEEHISINEIIEHNGGKVYRNRNEFADLKVEYNNFYPNNMKNEKYNYFIYTNGSLKMCNLKKKDKVIELAYVHLQKKKNLENNCKNENGKFVIVPRGFYNLREVNQKDFFKLNYKLIWYIKFRIVRKIKNIINV